MSVPKVHVYLLSYNTAPLIRHVIEHYSGFCSRIFIMDNMSTDSSADMAREFPLVTVIPWEMSEVVVEKTLIYMKSETYRNYSRAGGRFTEEVADWVISCDMDELLYHPNILQVLADLSDQGVTVPKVRGVDVVSESDPLPGVALTSQYNEGFRNKVFDKRIVFHPDFNMSYNFGSHPYGPGYEYMKYTLGYATTQDAQLTLLHFKRIGSLYKGFSEEYFNRLPAETRKKAHAGNFHGVGSHYLSILKGDMPLVPHWATLQALFESDGTINTLLCVEEPQEQGNDYYVTARPGDLGYLAQLAEAWGSVDPGLAKRMGNIVQKFRGTRQK